LTFIASSWKAIRFTPLELCEKLAALVPRPRKNVVSFHGVLAANARWRAEVVPRPPAARRHEHRRLTRSGGLAAPRWLAWSELLKRVFDVDGFLCPTCNRPMRLRALIEAPPLTTRIIDALAGAARAPPVAPALA
jgi:hypothetical protein